MDETTLLYDMRLIPPGRMPFRRWRWELWRGSTLLASGWRTSERQAERALKTAAARSAHAALGLHALRPEEAQASGSLASGRPTHVHCGPVSCLLLPRFEATAG